MRKLSRGIPILQDLKTRVLQLMMDSWQIGEQETLVHLPKLKPNISVTRSRLASPTVAASTRERTQPEAVASLTTTIREVTSMVMSSRDPDQRPRLATELT